MNLLSSKRAFVEFSQMLWRNRWVSLGTVLAMAMVFFLTFLVLTLNNSSQRVIDRVERKVDIGVFFQKDTPSFQAEAFLTELDRLQDDERIKGYTYFSEEHALEEMKKKFPEKVRFIERYQFENPLQASVEIVPGTWGPEELFQFLEQPRFKTLFDLKFFDRYEEKKVEVQRVLRLLSFIRQGGFFLGLIFVGVSGLLIGFFVSSTLHQKKREIFIMRLVGASHSFIRLPFLLVGIALGLMAFMMSFFFFFLFLQGIGPKLVNFFASSDQLFMSELFFEIERDFLGSFLPGLLLLTFLAGVISFVTVERFLRKRHLFSE